MLADCAHQHAAAATDQPAPAGEAGTGSRAARATAAAALVLQQHARCGRSLPVSSGSRLPPQDAAGACDADGRRAALVAQLVAEEGAARAALEALKQGAALSKAREAGERVLQQARDLQGAASLTHSTTSGNRAAAGRLRLQSVLLHPGVGVGQAPAAADEADGDASSADGSMHSEAAVGPNTCQHSALPRTRPHTQQQQKHAAIVEPPAQLQQQQPHLPASAGQAHGYVAGLEQQVAALQFSLATQHHAHQHLQLQQPPFTNGACPGFSSQQGYVVAPQPHCHPAFLQPAQLSNGTLGGYGMQLPPTALVASAVSAAAAADPSLAAAVSAHTRDMTLLRMEVERTRGSSELQAARAELASLQGAGPGGSSSRQQQHAPPQSAGDAPAVAAPQQQQQQCRAGDDAEGAASDGEHDDDAAAAGGNALMLGDDAWLPAAIRDDDASVAGGTAPPQGGEQEEVLTSGRPDAGLAAARGSGGQPDVLQVTINTAGPFSKHGLYRFAAVLFEGFQPLAAGPSSSQVAASTSRRLVVPGPGASGSTCTAPSSSSASADAAAALTPGSVACFQESLSIKGVCLTASTQLVLQLFCAKPSVAGLPSKEALVAWAVTPLLSGGQVLPGMQSHPLLRLPIMLGAAPGTRQWSYDGALVDLRLARYSGAPGDVEVALHDGVAPAGRPLSGGARGSGGAAAAAGVKSHSGHEDLPGVPAEAWVRVSRGVLPSEPYTPGDGISVVVDGARFLPVSTTISRVVVSAWSSSGALLVGSCESVARPATDARFPTYSCNAALDAAHNASCFEDPTATLMLQVHTIERTSRTLRVVGFALLPLFLDPHTGMQSLSRSTSDYVLNAGAFQVPLHAGAPATNAPLRVSSLDGVPHVPCASLLVRIMTAEAAKLQRRKPPPSYADRGYDSVSRAMPTLLERRLFGRLLSAHTPLSVREAARLVAWFRHQAGGLSGRRPSSNSASSSRRATGHNMPAAASSTAAAAAIAAAASARSGGGRGGLLGWLLRIGGGGGGEEEDAALAVSLALNTGDPAAAIAENPADLEAAKAELLPPSDGETMDLIGDMMEEASRAQKGSSSGRDKGGSSDTAAQPLLLPFINFNTASTYDGELGFFVALDGATRLSRPLPAGAIITSSPPGALYADQHVGHHEPLTLTLDYDLQAQLSAPRWLDGLQAFTGLPYHPGLVLLLDVRFLVPGSSSGAPAGWACLPVFEAAGPHVASGVWHLPLFQGVPASQLLAELSAGGDPDAVMAAAIASGRVRPTLDCTGVVVRLLCGSRQGQLDVPAWSLPLTEHRLTRHTVAALGPRFVAEMRRSIRTNTYAASKPQALTDEAYVDSINSTLLRVAGVDDRLGGGGEDEGGY